MSISPEGRGKIDEGKILAQTVYHKASLLPDAVTMRDYNPQDSNTELTRFGAKVSLDVENVNNPSYFFQLIFQDMARELYLTEERILIKHLQKDTELMSERGLNYETINRAVVDLNNQGFNPTIIFAPIKYYDISIQWFEPSGRPRFVWEKNESLRMESGLKLRMIWSSNPVPFDDFFILDKRWATWIASPSVEDRFSINEMLEREKLNLVFGISYVLQINDLRAVRRIQILPQESYESSHS